MTIGYLPHGVGNVYAQQLLAAGCQKTIIGPQQNKEAALLAIAGSTGEKDVLVFCRLDHLGTTADLLRIAIELGKRRAHLKIIAESIDTLRDTLNQELGNC